MSLFGALSSGVSGLNAQSSALGAIADNVTNVNTVGYKGTRVQFQTLVTAQASNTRYSPGGVLPAPDTRINAQGLLQASESSTDISIFGQGFFVVNELPNATAFSQFAYTRAGSFDIDKNGYLRNTAGWYLQGWPLDIAGQSTEGFATVQVGTDTYIKTYQNEDGEMVAINENIVTNEDLRPINLQAIGGTAAETKNIRLSANLPSGAPIGASENQPTLMYDTLGTQTNLPLVWTKLFTNGWGLSSRTPPGAATLELHGSDEIDEGPDIYAASGLLEFTGVPADGERIVITDGSGQPITFEFDTDGSVTETATYRQVDISAETVFEASHVAPLLKEAIDNSNLQGTDRFETSGADIRITQSIMGAAIGIDASGILAVRQNAANTTPTGNGVFTVSEIDFAYKNGARIDFEPPHATPTTGVDISFPAGNTIQASAGNPFLGWRPGDSITVAAGATPTEANTANNDGTYTIQNVSADGRTITLTTAPFQAGSLTTEVDGSSLRIYNNSNPLAVYNNLDTTITPSTTATAKVFRLHQPAQATAANPFNINLTDRVTSFTGAGVNFNIDATGSALDDTITAVAGTFATYRVGDTITLTGMTTAGNNGTFTITDVSADGSTLTFAEGSFGGDELGDNAAEELALVRHSISSVGAFTDFSVGDVITISNADDTGNNVTLTVLAATADTIQFAAGATTTLQAANPADDDIRVTIDRDATGNIDYVDIGSATSLSEIVAQLAADINENPDITTPSRFKANGVSLVFEQSPIGDDINIQIDSRTGGNSDGLITSVWQNSVTMGASTASDGEIMAMVETPYGAKKAAVNFNGTGTPASFNVDNIDIQWANGAADQEYASVGNDTRIDLFLGNINTRINSITQNNGPFSLGNSSQDGAKFGSFSGVSIDETGIVTARFDNGVTRPVYQIPVTTFANPNGLEARSGNVYIETDDSGQPTVREAGEGGAGVMSGNALEASTVDLGSEFTSMIVTQRAYSASAKIITTADEMLDELLRIR